MEFKESSPVLYSASRVFNVSAPKTKLGVASLTQSFLTFLVHLL